MRDGRIASESTICMSLSPTDGSSFESVSFRAIAFFPTHLHLYIANPASYLDSRSISYRHGNFLALGDVMQPIYGLLA